MKRLKMLRTQVGMAPADETLDDTAGIKLTVIERLGQAPHGLVRTGCACYTTAEEVDRLLAGVRTL
jgi:hypothetical protein